MTTKFEIVIDRNKIIFFNYAIYEYRFLYLY